MATLFFMSGFPEKDVKNSKWQGSGGVGKDPCLRSLLSPSGFARCLHTIVCFILLFHLPCIVQHKLCFNVVLSHDFDSLKLFTAVAH